jgi:hypothetical protein
MMHSTVLGTALLSLAGFTAAQIGETYLEMWSSELCAAGENPIGYSIEGTEWPVCHTLSGLFPTDLFERDSSGNVLVYVNGNSIAEGCKFGILQHQADVPDGKQSFYQVLNPSS